MILEGPIDQQPRPVPPSPLISSARQIVYAQLIAVIPTILLGRSEAWGYGQLLIIFAPFVYVLSVSTSPSPPSFLFNH